MREYLIHFRYRFVAVLAPIFLWGAALCGRPVSLRLGLAFAAFHGFLYAGANAFNSACDRDTGPIGGLREPPPPPRHLAGVAIGTQCAGLPLVLPAGPWVIGAYILFFLLSVGYSHPVLRWKASPAASVAIVAFGQGVLAFAAGWFSANPAGAAAWATPETLAAAGVSIITAGLYPLTQLYQVPADAAAGIRTCAAFLGPRGTLRVFLLAFALGTLALAGAVAGRWGLVEGGLVCVYGAGFLPLAARRIVPGISQSGTAAYRRIMPVLYLNSACFTGYVLFRLGVNSGAW